MKKVLKNNGKSLKLTTLGFTLIELLVVIIILAIVALITTSIILDVVEDPYAVGDLLKVDVGG